MRLIRYSLLVVSVILLVSQLSCTKDKAMSANQSASRLPDRVAQDFSYRQGKWYSVTDGTNQGISNTLLDTLWFVSDSVAGWTGFGGAPYTFMPTYFPDFFHIVYVIQDPLIPDKIDTVSHKCAMTLTGDTFAIYWDNYFDVFVERFVKKKN